MKKNKNIVFLGLLNSLIVLLTFLITFYFLFRLSLHQQRERVEEIVKSQANLIEAVSKHNAVDHKNPAQETLGQVEDSLHLFGGFGNTGELVLAYLDDDKIVYRLIQRYPEKYKKPIPMGSDIAEPMQQALLMKSGSMVGKDYRGVRVLGAYEFIKFHKWGIVAKIDLAEIYTPLFKTGLVACGITIFMIILGTAIYMKITQSIAIKDQERENFIQNILNTVIDGIVTIDSRGIIQSVNNAMLQIFGYAESEMVGKNVNIIMPEPYCVDHDKYIESYLSTGKSKVIGIGRHVEGKRKGGEIFPMYLGVAELKTLDGIFFTGVCRDITKQKKAEIMQKEFISSVSHELRTPLTSIKGSLGLIKGGVGGEIPDQIAKLLEMTNRNTDSLLNLINDLLDFQKIDAGKIEIKYDLFLIDELVGMTVKRNMHFAQQFNVELEIKNKLEKQYNIITDKERFAQVLTNLISNAVKFSPENEKVIIEIEKRGGEILVHVKDLGPGVEPDFVPELFKQFSQATVKIQKMVGGTGLGLSIAKSLMKKIGGTLEYSPNSPSGSCFTIIIKESHTRFNAP
jgi:PAS domain S-box-containing protein